MAVYIVMAQPSQPIQRKLIKYRKLKDIDIDQLNRDLEVSDTVTGSIHDMVEDLESKLLQALNKHVPEITETVTVRHRILWYTDKIKEQKRIICRREHVWQKYKLESNWIGLKEERKWHWLMLSPEKQLRLKK